MIFFLINFPQGLGNRKTDFKLIFFLSFLNHENLINHLDSLCLDFGKEVVLDDMQEDVIYFFVLEIL